MITPTKKQAIATDLSHLKAESRANTPADLRVFMTYSRADGLNIKRVMFCEVKNVI